MDDAERVPSQKVQDLAEAVVSLTLQVIFHSKDRIFKLELEK